MDASKRINSYGAQVRASHKHKQSKAVIPSRSVQDAMSKRWEIEPLHLYLVRDPDGNTLRLYKDLNRARNWTRGTSRIIIYNKPAQKNLQGGVSMEHAPQSGNALTLTLIGLIPFAMILLALFKLFG